jgi:signal transduction histidine kinase
VRVSCESRDEQLLIQVSDTGEGIAPEMIARLFTPFDRLGAEQRGIDGVGIGLTLSKWLVELMKGTLTVVSEPGVGTTFSVALPLAQHISNERLEANGRQTAVLETN